MEHPPTLALSHFELRVNDLARMERFYTHVLGFVVTDRGSAPAGLVFLSRHPGEHHQIVLNPTAETRVQPNVLDHLAFRVVSLKNLRRIHEALIEEPDVSFETVSHGTTWSIYFTDPEENRLEVFTDTPWHVAQPLRFPIDLTCSDTELLKSTEVKIKNLPGFKTVDEWRIWHVNQLEG